MSSEGMEGDELQQQELEQAVPAAPPLDDAATLGEEEQCSPKMRRGFSSNLMRAAKSHWGVLRGVMMSGLRAMSLAKRDKQEFHEESTKALQEADTDDSAIKLEVEDIKELKNTNYILQGDAAFYSEEMINKRHKLRNKPEVMAAIKEWWDWLPKFNGAIEGLPVPSDLSRTYLAKPVYCAMVVVIQMVLLPRFGMKGRLNYDPEEDWLDDNKGQPKMDYPDFFDAMFELADVWCDQVNGYKYADLLEQILRDAKRSGLMDKLLLKFGWFPEYVVPNPNAVVPAPKPKALPKPVDPAPFIRPVVETSKHAPERHQLQKRPTEVTCHKVDPADWFGSTVQPVSPQSPFTRDREAAAARLALLASQGGSQDPSGQKVHLVASTVAETQRPSLLHQQSLGHHRGAVTSTLIFTSRPATCNLSPGRAVYGSNSHANSTGSLPCNRKGGKDIDPAAARGSEGSQSSGLPGVEKRGASMTQVASGTGSPCENPAGSPTAFERLHQRQGSPQRQHQQQQQHRAKASTKALTQSLSLSKRPGAQQLPYYSGPLPHFTQAGKARSEVAQRQQRLEEEWRLSASPM